MQPRIANRSNNLPELHAQDAAPCLSAGEYGTSVYKGYGRRAQLPEITGIMNMTALSKSTHDAKDSEVGEDSDKEATVKGMEMQVASASRDGYYMWRNQD